MSDKKVYELNADAPTVRFLACGHVDDGKSTLIGRLLYEIGAITDDQIAAITKNGKLDFARITDGLEDELSQGITIDVAYRYFRYSGRHYILADTPGHMQYTRNMTVAASSSDYAFILVDASHGVREQTLRHSRIAAFFGIKHFVVVVNKMDLVDYNQQIFEQIKNDYLAAFSEIDPAKFTFVPVSAINGDNVTEKSKNMSWYAGPTALEILKNLDVPAKSHIPARLPVQQVVLTPEGKRGYQGRLSGSLLKVGDKVHSVGTGREALVSAIYHSGHEVQQAADGQSITVVIDREEDISRGNVLAVTNAEIKTSDAFDAKILWLDDAFENTHSFQGVLKIHHQETEALVNVSAGEVGTLVAADVETASPVALDSFFTNHHTGLFLLIQPDSEKVAAVGAVIKPFKVDSAWQI